MPSFRMSEKGSESTLLHNDLVSNEENEGKMRHHIFQEKTIRYPIQFAAIRLNGLTLCSQHDSKNFGDMYWCIPIRRRVLRCQKCISWLETARKYPIEIHKIYSLTALVENLRFSLVLLCNCYIVIHTMKVTFTTKIMINLI